MMDQTHSRSEIQRLLSAINLSHVLTILQEIGKTGDELAGAVYVVGGFVRDLLVGRSNLDLDVVVEGDALRLANKLAEVWGGTTRTHRQFGTATVTLTDGMKIDLASARSETYACPGALPSVRYGILEDDLRRRDFSINALAISLNSNTFGEIVDHTGGLRDLRAGRIRALHDQSFMDDPTRIFRAIRYEQRYGFQIIERDQDRVRDAVQQNALNLISGQRIRNEIDRILLESVTPHIIRRMRDFDLFRATVQEWEIPQNFESRWATAQHAVDWAAAHLRNVQIDTGAVRWLALFDTPRIVESVSDRLVLESQLRTKLATKEEVRRATEVVSARSKPSEVYQLLNPYPLEPIIYTMMEPDQPNWRADKIENYVICLRKVRPLINGDDLIQLGLKPGRAFADLLWKAYAAQLDGKVSTKEEVYHILEC